MAGSACRECGSTGWITRQVGLTLVQNSPEHKPVECKVHGWANVTGQGTSRSSLSFKFPWPLPTWPPPKPLEILLVAKLRALCLHSRFINPLIPSARSFHVLPPVRAISQENNMNWSTSVYTTLSSDTEPSIVITFDSAKYIFNAGENTTRAVFQNKKGWRKVKALFLTQLGTQRSSGVPGVFLDSSLSVVHSPDLLMTLSLSPLVQAFSCLWQIAMPERWRLSVQEAFCIFLLPCASMYFGSSVGCMFLSRPYSIRCFVLRNTLGLNVTETPDFKTEPVVEAIPVFSDDKITVFSIPIVPTSHDRCEIPAESEALSNASENVLKRKREPSPESPLKRPFLGSTAPITDGPTTLSVTSPLLDRFLADPTFDPATLEGDEADAWRQLIIKHMFTWVEPPSLPSKHTNKNGKRERNVEDTETKNPEAHPSQVSLPQVPHWVEGVAKCQEKPPSRGPRHASPTGLLKPLPTFTPPVRDGSTAYIVVGPRVRGKFDVKRAEELGLYGPLRGRVVRGETVTFTVDDGTGAKVQRTVKPEDCIGEHENTKVRFSHFSALFTVLNLCSRLL